MKFSKKSKIALAILLIIVTLLFTANFIVSNLLSKKVAGLLMNQKIENHQVSIAKTKFSLFDRSIVFNEIHFTPSDSAMIKLKDKSPDLNSLHKISISRLKLKGIHLIPVIFSKNITVEQLIIDDPLYQRFNSNKKIEPVKKSKNLNLDSIAIQGIGGFELDRVKVSNLKFQVVDVENNKITFENKPMSFALSGFKLEDTGDQIFKISAVDDIFEMTTINVDFPKEKYSFSLDKIHFNFEENTLLIKNLSFVPSIDKAKLANTYRFNKEVYTMGLEEMKIYKLDLQKLIENKGIFMDSIQISGYSIDIYKDKRKPFDESKRPEFPQNLLKKTKTPILIPKITINKSKFFYEERLENKDLTMKVSMHDLNINIRNVTSIKAYREEPLIIDMNAQLMNKAPLDLHIILPLKDDEHTFTFKGELGASHLKYYDSAIIPAVGLKVLNGELQHMTFNATANEYSSAGTMTMLYSDLEAEVFKHKNNDRSGFLSWGVNSVVHKSNPGKNGKVREVMMNFDRVSYKGFGNVLWKTLQSGIVNTIAPFGKSAEKEEGKKEKHEKKEKKKKNK
jgi:hypothetical protein